MRGSARAAAGVLAAAAIVATGPGAAAHAQAPEFSSSGTVATGSLDPVAEALGSQVWTDPPLVHPGQMFEVVGPRNLCTVAAVGTGDEGQPRALTAGHCVPPGAEVLVRSGARGRSVHAVVDPARGLDYAIIEFAPGTVLSPTSTPAPFGSTAFPLPTEGVADSGSVLVKDGGRSGRHLQIPVFAEGDRIYYVGVRIPGDSGSPVRTLDGRLVAINGQEAFHGVVVSYGTRAQAAIDDFNAAGRGGFLPFFG